MEYVLGIVYVSYAFIFVFSGALTLHDVIMELSSQTSGNGIQRVQVRRENVLDDMIREVGKKSFNCNCSNMKTWFVGELGIDYGGLTRELWSLLAKEIKFKLCTGKSPNMSLKPNPMKLQVKLISNCTLVGWSPNTVPIQ